MGDKSAEQFTAKERSSIGAVCWIMSNLVHERGETDRALDLLQKGAAFGNHNCLEILETPPIDIDLRPGTFSGFVLKITNNGSSPLLAHIVVRNDDVSATDFEHDVMLPAEQETELGWLEMSRNIALGDTILVICQGYSFAKLVRVHDDGNAEVSAVNLADDNEKAKQ